MNYQIVRSSRRTLAIEIKSEGTLLVRAPRFTPLGLIEKLLGEKREWIETKQRLIARRKPKNKVFCHGEIFVYLGMGYQLTIVEEAVLPFAFANEFRLASAHLPKAREHFLAWYKQQAYKIITDRVAWYAGLTGIDYNLVKITGADKRWGSCNAKGNLHFSWRLVMAPINIIDYVVVHELVHVNEKNHAAKFWQKVSEILPEYKQYRKWLKEKGHCLTL